MEKYKNLKKKELVDKCKEKGLNTYGTKIELINRILSTERNDIINIIKHSIPPIYIKKYNDTLYIHQDTGLLLDMEDKIVIGRLRDNNIQSLVLTDIELCKKYKFRYKLPNNLSDINTQKFTPDVDYLLKQRLIQIEQNEVGEEDDASENEDDDP